jgi:hypothetical protein
MLLLQYSLLCFGLPSYKADFVVRDDLATSVADSYPGDDREMLEEGDLYSMYSQLDNAEFETLLKQFERITSQHSLEEKVNISTSGNSYGMENRTQGSNPTWNDKVLNSIIHHQVVMVILLVLLLICIAAALCCGCRCLARSAYFACGFCPPRRRKHNPQNCVATDPPEGLVEAGEGKEHKTTVVLNEVCAGD